MHSTTHFLLSWLVADSAPLNRRERAIVTVAGVVPDIDALGVVAELATRGSDTPLLWWSENHHVLAHNLAFGFMYAVGAFALATKRWRTALLAFLCFHLHLLCDVIGARGPDGYQWPISYLFPFSEKWQLVWDGQWALNAWPNFFITAIALALTLYLAIKRGYSPIEMVSKKADRVFVETLRKRFPQTRDEPNG
ncbi:MAG: metal-dependent hydrolase [bacterium]